MRRSASEIIRNLETRIARLERQASPLRGVNAVAMDLIKRRWKGLNGVFKRTRSGLEMKKPIMRAGNIYFYVEGVEGVEGVIEVNESRQNDNELVVDHKMVGKGVVNSWTIDVNEFISPNIDNPNTYNIEDWDLPNPQALKGLLLSGLRTIKQIQKDDSETFLELLIKEGNDYLNQIKITSRRLNSFGAVEGIIRSEGLEITVGDSPNKFDHIVVTFHTIGEDDYLAQMELDAHALDPTDFEDMVMRKAKRV